MCAGIGTTNTRLARGVHGRGRNQQDVARQIGESRFAPRDSEAHLANLIDKLGKTRFNFLALVALSVTTLCANHLAKSETLLCQTHTGRDNHEHLPCVYHKEIDLNFFLFSRLVD